MKYHLKHAPKALTLCLLAATAMPANAVFIDTPAVRDGKRFGIFVSVEPTLTTTSNKFSYTYGDPSIYGANGTIEQVLADQDRKDSDEQYRLDNVGYGLVEFYTQQKLTKKMSLGGSLLIQANPDSLTNFGAYWGTRLDFGSWGELGSITLGGRNNGLSVGQTGINMLNTINDSGFNINGRYTGIPDLTLSAYHMFSQSADVRNRRTGGWHDSNGVSAKYEFNLAPRKNATIALGASRSKGHDLPFYWDAAARGKGYMAGFKAQYNDLTFAADYGEKEQRFNGLYIDDINTKTYGAKIDYEITPRLTTNISYGHKKTKNSKPIDFAFWRDELQTPSSNANIEEKLFNQVKQDRYGLGVNYQIYKGFSVNGSVNSTKTRNYVAEGEFSKRERLDVNVGASFSF